MAGLLQLRRSALRMLIFYAAPPLLMGKSGHRLRFDVICRNTPAFLAPRSGELPGEARLRGFILPACGTIKPCHDAILLRCFIAESRTKCDSIPKEPAVLHPIASDCDIYGTGHSANTDSAFHSGHLPLHRR